MTLEYIHASRGTEFLICDGETFVARVSTERDAKLFCQADALATKLTECMPYIPLAMKLDAFDILYRARHG